MESELGPKKPSINEKINKWLGWIDRMHTKAKLDVVYRKKSKKRQKFTFEGKYR